MADQDDWTSGWALDGMVEAIWPQAAEEVDDTALQIVLDAALQQCIAFAPKPSEVDFLVETDGEFPGYAVPMNWRVALIMQARNIYNASKVDSGSGGMGEEGFILRPYPMDWSVKNLIRPKRGKPVIG
jgi:hypothetical protein